MLDEAVNRARTASSPEEGAHVSPEHHALILRNILFGVYHDDVKLASQREASARITVLLSAMGYDFYDTYECGRANHGFSRCMGPMRFKDSSHVLSYLGEERAEGWHAMILASLPAVAQLHLKRNGSALMSTEDMTKILTGKPEVLERYDPVW